jgi:predicted membrane protein (TIGR00267 family)
MTSIDEIEQLSKISRLGPIARRYFAMNAFDGTLTIMGIILGSHFALLHDARLVIGAGVGACLAMMFSGLAGTYLVEKAERERELLRTERAMLKSMDDTVLKKASRFAVFVSAFVDGFAPFIAGIFCLAPFIAISFGLLFWDLAVIISTVTGFSMLFLLGVFLGRVSEQSPWLFGIQTLGAGLATATAIIILEIFKII